MSEHDPVNRPKHYTAHPSGVECIQITEHMNFCIGNAVKYLWRAGLKGDALEDLEKARWYIDREIDRRKRKPMPKGLVEMPKPELARKRSCTTCAHADAPYGSKVCVDCASASEMFDLLNWEPRG